MIYAVHQSVKHDSVFLWVMWNGCCVGMKCAKCNCDMVPGEITKDDGTKVSVTKCPNGCGMIKSPMCCGSDMTCAI